MENNKPNTNNATSEDTSDIANAAIQTFNIYSAYIKAGFSKEEAMRLLIALITKPAPVTNADVQAEKSILGRFSI